MAVKKGFYNRHSQPQAGAAAQGFALFERAAREVPLDDLVEVADLACFHGGNSMEPMRRAACILRERSPGASIEVTHTDLPTNDFNPVFELLSGPDSYLGPGVRASVRAGSFYQPLFRQASQSLIWCSAATHWLSRVPAPAHPTYAAQWSEQARQDWQAWIDSRAEELRPGGQLVMVGSGADSFGRTGAEGLVTMVRDTMAEVLGPRQKGRLALPTYHRTLREWLAPLGPKLTLKEVLEPPMPEPYWEEYQQTGNLETYVDRVVSFAIAALTQPLLKRQGGKELERRLRQRVQAHPDLARPRWWLIVLRLERV